MRSAVQSQKAVSAYFTSEQIPHLGFADQIFLSAVCFFCLCLLTFLSDTAISITRFRYYISRRIYPPYQFLMISWRVLHRSALGVPQSPPRRIVLNKTPKTEVG